MNGGYSKVVPSEQKSNDFTMPDLPPVLILFANLKGNLGDFAILHAMLVEAEKWFPGREIHVFSHGKHSVDAARFKSFLAQPHPAFKDMGKGPYRTFSRLLSVFKRIGLEKCLRGRLVERMSQEIAAQAPLSQAGKYAAIFFAGGEQWSGFENGVSMFATLRAVSRQNANVFVFPFSVKGKLLDSYPAVDLQRDFGGFAGNVIVRDSHSAEIMQRIRPSVMLGADCVFSLADVAATLPAARPEEDKCVMLAITTGDGARYQDVATATKALLAAGHRVRLLTTCDREDGDEIRRLGELLGIEHLSPPNWQEVVSEFRSSSLVVTNRLHCMIFTFFAGVPLLPLVNREKIIGISRDAELPHTLKDVKDLTPEIVATCQHNQETILAKMRGYLEKVKSSKTSPRTE